MLTGWRRLFVVLCLVMGMIGCANTKELTRNTTEFYIDGIPLAKITQDTLGQATLKKNGVEMSVDTRQENFWQRNVMPIFQRVVTQTEGRVE